MDTSTNIRQGRFPFRYMLQYAAAVHIINSYVAEWLLQGRNLKCYPRAVFGCFYRRACELENFWRYVHCNDFGAALSQLSCPQTRSTTGVHPSAFRNELCEKPVIHRIIQLVLFWTSPVNVSPLIMNR